MLRALGFLIGGFLLASVGFAQEQTDLFSKASPQVEQALRERVTKFYQAHVDSKFRVADTVVAEEAKDQFFAMSKPVYKKFEILKITYTENFAKANVVTVVERDMNLRGNNFATKAPVTTTWKVIDGQWFWYVDTNNLEGKTPMGDGRAGPVSGRPAGMPADFRDMINDPKRRAELADSIRHKVAVDKTDLTFAVDKPGSDTIEVANSLDGPIKIELEMVTKVEGLTATADSVEVAGGAKTAIRVKYIPGKIDPKLNAGLVISIPQTAQVFNVAIRFAESQ